MLLIIDGHSIAYRAFYKTPPFTTIDGFPTGVIHTFLSTLIKLKNDLKPASIIVAFDSKGETHRHKKLKEYKATRQPAPDDLIIQVEELKKIITLAGISVCARDGFEADDIIYTIAKNSKIDVLLLTKDKDIFQIVDNKIKIYDDSSGEFIDREGVYEKFGVYPEQIPDYLALVGDSSDNIPGVRGIGQKTARELLDKYKSLDELYNHLDELKQGLKGKLIEEKDIAFLSRELTKLEFIKDLDIAESKSDDEKFKKCLIKLELNTIYSRIFMDKPSIYRADSAEYSDVIIYHSGSIFRASKGALEEVTDMDFKNYKYFYDYKNIYKTTKQKLEDFYDLNIISWLNDPDLGGISKSKNESIEEFAEKLSKVAEKEIISLQDRKLDYIYTNIEKEIIFILAEMELKGIKVDRKIIKNSAERLSELKGKIEKEILTYFGYSFNLNSPKQLSGALFNKLGIKPIKKIKTGLSTSEESLKEIAANSCTHSQLIEKILYYREINKLLSTYTLKLIDYIDDNDGRIHADFKQTGTSTGRLSSNNPNLQNIPQRGELSRDIRVSFVPEEGCRFVSFDYSQIELRILAHLSEDEKLIMAFKNDLDIHDITARTLFDIDNTVIVPLNLRRVAKAVNFGIIYGLSAYGLSKGIGLPQSQAREFIDRYFNLYPDVKKYINQVINTARLRGYTETIMGRRRYIKDINSRNATNRLRAERVAINAPIQGTAADIIKIAMIKTDEYIKERGYKADMVLQVHDELIFEVESSIVQQFLLGIKEIMENVITLKVQLKVNAGIGENLGDLK